MDSNQNQQEKPGLTGRYLYAVVQANGVESLSLETTGLNGEGVYPVIGGSLAAIVSDIAPEELRPERRHLAAHHGVLRKMMDETTILPVAFGIIANDEDQVRDLLTEHQEAFTSQLDQLAGKVEMGVRCRVGNQKVFEYFVTKYPELRTMRDESFSQGEPSREQKIELGKLFQELLEGAREETAKTMEEGISDVTSMIRVNPARNETELLNMAVLIPREKLDAFGKAVEEVASKLDEQFEIDVNGPWPSYNFVDLRIHLEAPQEQEAH